MSQQRSWWFRFRGVIGTVFLIIFGAITALSSPMIPQDSWLALEMDVLAWIFFVAGAAFRFWATLYIGGRKSQVVVCEGPYSICRNPLYVGSLLLLLSAGLFLQSFTFLVGSILPMLAYLLGTIPAEENELRKKLGIAYVEYCQRTPRLWPRLSQFRTSETVEVRVRGLRIESQRALRWICIPLITILIAHLRTMAWWPHLFLLP